MIVRVEFKLKDVDRAVVPESISPKTPRRAVTVLAHLDFASGPSNICGKKVRKKLQLPFVPKDGQIFATMKCRDTLESCYMKEGP